MSQFHSTLSRRDFMKGLGLIGAGVGAATATAPMFHDLDEVIASPSARINMPWWVKQVDEPTTPIDWNVLPTLGTACDDNNGVVPNIRTRAEYQKVMLDYTMKQYPDWDKGPTLTGVPGPSPDLNYPDYVGDIKDNALCVGATLCNSGLFPTEVIQATGGKYTTIQDRPQGWRCVKPVEQRGGTKWQGTPEEALKVVRAAARFYGFDDVTAIPVDDKFLKVMWGQKRMLRMATPTKFEFGDVDDFVCTPEIQPMSKIVIPKRVKWFLQFSSRQLGEVTKHGVGTCQNAGQLYTYVNWIRTVKTIQEFLWGLGYISLDNINGRFAPTGATGIMAGAGELARWGAVMTPKYGIMVRVMHGVLTDLPLEQSSPINFGGREFCKTCGICAEACPMDAIQKGEPSWEVNHKWDNPGYLHWRNDRSKCGHCPVCQPVCPFNAMDKSFIHELVKGTVSTTPIFNSFFTGMDKNFNYGRKPPAEWWESEQPVGGFDSSV
ncbi:reductive dehalogenase [Dehalococcoides mccartyi BTF08]|uniref:reductive dehalogenase n=1 Tax=Dehalococcoides mccartyi TaxID=61435 RepID=UPI0002B76C2F|nr:reductive dehalogenase [Dehalococcoides mccartyi]AGG08511.1 reductive dehalogenase [Dehalococcoides mccartyi BTF08]